MKMVCRVFLWYCAVICTSQAVATTTLDITFYQSDGVTEIDPNYLMAGSTYVVVVHSESAEPWSGGLFVAGENRGLATLSGRGFDPNANDWTKSHLSSAGDAAIVQHYRDSAIWGFDLFTDPNDVSEGEWFVLDYQAHREGDPNILIYDYSVSWDIPVGFIQLHHVASSDLNSDGHVNLIDYVILNGNWHNQDCQDPNWCDGSDITRSGAVNISDLVVFSSFWLWPQWSPSPGGLPILPDDPNLTYMLLDDQDQSEIYLNVGETITLFLHKVSDPNSTLLGLDVEIHLSQTSLGTIDNLPYDPNNPPGDGTARLLVEPRMPGFDYWGPGVEQTEGIWFHAIAGIPIPLADGVLASFEYTATTVGDITLSIHPNNDIPAYFESIIIHQIDPNST